MAVDVVNFWMKPASFFDRNPALDVAPSDSDHGAPGAGHGDHGDHAGHDHGGMTHDTHDDTLHEH